MQNYFFNDVAIEWLKRKEGEIKISTYNKYEDIVYIHLIPHFKNLRIKEIDNSYIISFFKNKIEDYEYNTTKSIYITLILILHYAGRNDIIKWRQLRINKDKVLIDVLSEDECKLFNKELLNSNEYKNLGILLALNLGLRIGEVCGLRWKDIDLNMRSISINCTMQRVKNNSQNNSKTKVVLLEPKSINSKRILPIPNHIFNKLDQIKYSIQSAEAFLLTGETEKYIEPRNLERYFKKKCDELIGRQIKFHNLRHTYATISLLHINDSKAISETLGHSSVYTTITFYQSVRFKEKYNVIQQLASVIGG